MVNSLKKFRSLYQVAVIGATDKKMLMEDKLKHTASIFKAFTTEWMTCGKLLEHSLLITVTEILWTHRMSAVNGCLENLFLELPFDPTPLPHSTCTQCLLASLLLLLLVILVPFLPARPYFTSLHCTVLSPRNVPRALSLVRGVPLWTPGQSYPNLCYWNQHIVL